MRPAFRRRAGFSRSGLGACSETRQGRWHNRCSLGMRFCRWPGAYRLMGNPIPPVPRILPISGDGPMAAALFIFPLSLLSLSSDSPYVSNADGTSAPGGLNHGVSPHQLGEPVLHSVLDSIGERMGVAVIFPLPVGSGGYFSSLRERNHGFEYAVSEKSLRHERWTRHVAAHNGQVLSSSRRNPWRILLQLSTGRTSVRISRH